MKRKRDIKTEEQRMQLTLTFDSTPSNTAPEGSSLQSQLPSISMLWSLGHQRYKHR